MAWVRLDDQFFLHTKVMDLSAGACLLYLVALAHSNAALTDGRVTPARLRVCAAVRGLDDERALADELVGAGLWASDGDDLIIVGWPGGSGALFALGDGDVPARMEWNRLRGEIAPVIYQRDGHRCIACGAIRDLTIDHRLAIANGGDHDEANLQVLCRSCNSRKGAR